MPKTSYLAALGVLLLAWPVESAHAQAQEPLRVSLSVRVVAQVLDSGIELVTLREMHFGRVAPGDREIYINPIFNADAAQMRATGSSNRDIRVTFERRHELVHADGGPSLTFDYEVAGNSEDNQFTAQLLDLGDASIRFGPDGEFYLWIGGRLNIEHAQSGQYLGEFTIEIEYI